MCNQEATTCTQLQRWQSFTRAMPQWSTMPCRNPPLLLTGYYYSIRASKSTAIANVCNLRVHSWLKAFTVTTCLLGSPCAPCMLASC